MVVPEQYKLSVRHCCAKAPNEWCGACGERLLMMDAERWALGRVQHRDAKMLTVLAEEERIINVPTIVASDICDVCGGAIICKYADFLRDTEPAFVVKTFADSLSAPTEVWRHVNCMTQKGI